MPESTDAYPPDDVTASPWAYDAEHEQCDDGFQGLIDVWQWEIYATDDQMVLLSGTAVDDDPNPLLGRIVYLHNAALGGPVARRGCRATVTMPGGETRLCGLAQRHSAHQGSAVNLIPPHDYEPVLSGPEEVRDGE